MTGVATAIGVTGVIGAGAAIYAANKASGSQQQAAQQASNTQMQMFNQIQANEAPWVQQGQAANTALSQFYGLGGGSGTLDYNSILSNLPGYQFQLQQGEQAVKSNLAAQGLLESGAAGKTLTQFGQGLAQNYAGQYVQGLQNLSQFGQAGAAGVASAGMNAANQISGAQIYGGNAAASGAVAQGNAFNYGLQNLAGAYGMTQTPQYQYGPQGPYGINSQYGYLTGGQQWNPYAANPSTGYGMPTGGAYQPYEPDYVGP